MTAESERQMWCAVLQQAIEDATAPLGNDRNRNHEIEHARAWLTSPNRDFAEVCRLSGYEASRIRAQAIKLIAQVTPRDCPPPPKPRKRRAPRFKNPINEGQEANADR